MVMLQNLCLEKLAIDSEKEVQYSGMHLKQVKNGIRKKKSENVLAKSTKYHKILGTKMIDGMSSL
jgi:hypothetical protein